VLLSATDVLNTEQEVFAIVLFRFISAALSDFCSSPRMEIFGNVPLISYQ
jgi:hypothetical protein